MRCDNLLEPRVLHNTRDAAGGTYDHFLDTLQGKGDTRDIEPHRGVQLVDVSSAKVGRFSLENNGHFGVQSPNP